MQIEADTLYHIYNRGNNSQKIFFNNENYAFLLKKTEKELQPYCDILAYCLMPTHFPALFYAFFPAITRENFYKQPYLATIPDSLDNT